MGTPSPLLTEKGGRGKQKDSQPLPQFSQGKKPNFSMFMSPFDIREGEKKKKSKGKTTFLPAKKKESKGGKKPASKERQPYLE